MIKVAGVASVPEREAALHNMMLSILFQVDKLYVCLNGYSRVPEFLKNSKVQVFCRQNELGDAGKFIMAGEKNAYYFSCDDDIFYPQNYVATCISNLNHAGERVICTYGGRSFNKRRIKSYYQSPCRKVNLIVPNKSRQEIEFPYTGVASFNTRNVSVRINDFVIPNMADIWMGMIAKRRNYKCIAFPHNGKWFRYQRELMEGKRNIYDEASAKGDAIQTKIVNTYNYHSMKG